MHYINFNGKVVAENTAIIEANNRGFRYGDAVFETIKLKNGILILANAHFDRLWKGITLLQFEIPKLFTTAFLEKEIYNLAKKNNLQSARVRLTVFRGAGGIYDAVNHYPNFVIETIQLSAHTGLINTNGLDICLYTDAVKSIDAFSNCKTNNYLPYFMGALFAKKMKCNDAIIVNSQGNVCDTTIANIFLIKNSHIYTPSLQQGCVAGVMRQCVLHNLKKMNYSIEDGIVTKQNIIDADEIFLTNSIYNIRWVSSFENKMYNNTIIKKISNNLVLKEPQIFS